MAGVLAKLSGGIGAFVLLETYKPLLLRRAWLPAAACVAFSFVLGCVALSTAAGAEAVGLLGALTFMCTSLVGWWVCNNKKDDLVMMRAIERFGGLLGELNEAESRLRSSLNTMLLCDTDMEKLTDELETAFAQAEAELSTIRAQNEKAIVGQRRSTIEQVLLQLADVDGSLKMGVLERRQLLRLICNMSGKSEGQLGRLREALALDSPADEDDLDEASVTQASVHSVLDILERFKCFEMIMGLEVVGEEPAAEEASAGLPTGLWGEAAEAESEAAATDEADLEDSGGQGLRI